jgi:hypothetical protein
MALTVEGADGMVDRGVEVVGVAGGLHRTNVGSS